MRKVRNLAIVAAAALLSAFACGTSFPELDRSQPFSIVVEDSSSFVGIAKVSLSVSELEQKNGKLVGTYKIRVPLFNRRNDSGSICLEIPDNFLQFDIEGGKLVGEAISEKEDQPPSGVVCEVRPGDDRVIWLAITTDDRTIRFKSRYDVKQELAEESSVTVVAGAG